MILVRWAVVHDLPARVREGGDGVAVIFLVPLLLSHTSQTQQAW